MNNIRSSKVNRKAVEDLKSKARKEADNSTPPSGDSINEILYGPRTENGKAIGGGEFDQ